MSAHNIIARFPYIEVLYRHIYWRIPFVSSLAGKLASRIRASQSDDDHAIVSTPTLEEFHKGVLKLGLKKGDTVIVHAGIHRFVQAGHTPDEIILQLRETVGPSGTIVVPAMPLLRDEPVAAKRFDDRLFAKPFRYHKGKEHIWTGKLPRALVKCEGSHLSKIPLNSAAAIGAQAEYIIESQPIEPGMTPCGPTSLWARCFELDAKILMIDVNIAHSLTMIHVVEDLFEDEWPIQDWYRNREFIIVDGSSTQRIKMRERKPKWALFYCENRLNRDLLDYKIFLQNKTASGINLAIANSSDLVDFLRNKRPHTYPYFVPTMVGRRRG